MKLKLIRGGAWDGIAGLARCAYRNPGYQLDNLGFRCCFSPSFVIKRKVGK